MRLNIPAIGNDGDIWSAALENSIDDIFGLNIKPQYKRIIRDQELAWIHSDRVSTGWRSMGTFSDVCQVLNWDLAATRECVLKIIASGKTAWKIRKRDVKAAARRRRQLEMKEIWRTHGEENE